MRTSPVLSSCSPTPSQVKSDSAEFLSAFQAKKKYFDTELENLERQQKQQVEKMEQDHAVRRREEAKRIRLEQERDYGRFQEQLRLMKKEVRAGRGRGSGRPGTLSVASDRDPSSASLWQQNLGISLTWEAHVQVSDLPAAPAPGGATPLSSGLCFPVPAPRQALPCGLGSFLHFLQLSSPSRKALGEQDGGPGDVRRCHQQGAWVLGGQTHVRCVLPYLWEQQFGLKHPSPSFPTQTEGGEGGGGGKEGAGPETSGVGRRLWVPKNN